MSGTAKAVLKRRIAAPVEAVFEACTRSDLLARWLSPPRVRDLRSRG